MGFSKDTNKADRVLSASRELRQFREAGEKFNYMGVEMLVTRHLIFADQEHPSATIPSLVADYVSKPGKIKTITFSIHQLEMLRNMNPEKIMYTAKLMARKGQLEQELNKSIEDLIEKFEEDSGIQVSDLVVHRDAVEKTSDEPTRYITKITVKLYTP